MNARKGLLPAAGLSAALVLTLSSTSSESNIDSKGEQSRTQSLLAVRGEVAKTVAIEAMPIKPPTQDELYPKNLSEKGKEPGHNPNQEASRARILHVAENRKRYATAVRLPVVNRNIPMPDGVRNNRHDKKRHAKNMAHRESRRTS